MIFKHTTSISGRPSRSRKGIRRGGCPHITSTLRLPMTSGLPIPRSPTTLDRAMCCRLGGGSRNLLQMPSHLPPVRREMGNTIRLRKITVPLASEITAPPSNVVPKRSTPPSPNAKPHRTARHLAVCLGTTQRSFGMMDSILTRMDSILTRIAPPGGRRNVHRTANERAVPQQTNCRPNSEKGPKFDADNQLR